MDYPFATISLDNVEKAMEDDEVLKKLTATIRMAAVHDFFVKAAEDGSDSKQLPVFCEDCLDLTLYSKDTGDAGFTMCLSD